VDRLRKRQGQQGVALVITLAFVVLLTGLIVAYFSRTMSDRKLSDNSFSQAAADRLASSALSVITGNLKQEIVNGSTVLSGSVSSWPLVYVAGTNSAAMVPTRNGVSGTWNATGAPVKTLIRVSSTNIIASPGVDLQASNASGTSTSANGKRVSAARWNTHYLLPLKTPATPTDTTPDTNFTPPNWIYVTSGGPANPALTTPSTSVTGRYAYAIYDEGALLDANVAGYPYVSGTTPTQFIYKGALTYADLTQLPGLTQTGVNNLVAWRNYASLQSTGTFPKLVPSSTVVGGTSGLNYVNWIQSGTTGFLVASGATYNGSTDQVFMSRRQLIDLATATGTADFNPTALQYLGTFSRALTAPTWFPTQVTPNVNYVANAEAAGSENRDLANVRFSGTATSITHYADDGTPTPYSVKPGDPLLQHRFSLKRLDWFTPTGPAAGKATAIQDCFGLTWDVANSRWTYKHDDASNILTLDQVSAKNREPDFFELLKASILDGSLGKDPGRQNPATGDSGAEISGRGGLTVNGPAGMFFNVYSAISDTQIIQIGANIIDQYDADSLPTAIYFFATSNPDTFSATLTDLFNTFHGIENLPYLFSLRPIMWKDTVNNTKYGWLQPAMWNPHQTLPAGYSGTIPTSYRLHAYGRGQTWAYSGGAGTYSYEPTPTTPGVQFITFTDTSSAFYTRPVFLTTAESASTGTANVWQSSYGGANPFVAFFCGSGTIKSSGTPPESGSIIGTNHPYDITVVAEYWNGTNFIPYTRLARYDASCASPTAPQNPSNIQGIDVSRPDPRTDRFSISMRDKGTTSTHWQDNGTAPYQAAWFGPSTTSGFVYLPASSGGGVTNRPGLYSLNLIQTGTTSYYSDPDGVVRPADGYRGNNVTGDGRPTFISNGAPTGSPTATGDTGNTQNGRRPVILNRPFRSVGELGYVFRDEPFKSLDFWSASSADAALLDVFDIRDQPAAVVAGMVNPNNAPAPVLQAIIAGAAKKETDTAYNISAESAAVGQAIANYLASNKPLGNRADLVIAATGAANLSGSINAAFSTSADKANKAYGEAPVRALADVTNTRTWNLMIDVIAQTGVFPPSAPSTTQALTSSFVVQGERRYWLHIAIDRFTGKVIDQQLEPVYE